MVEKGMACVKYLLFAFNLLFFIFGVVLLGVGIYAQVKLSSYLNFTNSNISAPAILIIIVGSVTLFVGFFGCCGAIKENHCMVMTFAVLIAILLICEISAGIAGYVLQGKVEDLFKNTMKDSMKKYDSDKATKAAWDEMQNELKCCGTNNSDDWRTVASMAELPSSCCDGDSKECKKSSRTGCLKALENEFTKNIGYVAGVGIGLGVVELLGIILACCLGSAIRNEYEVA